MGADLKIWTGSVKPAGRKNQQNKGGLNRGRGNLNRTKYKVGAFIHWKDRWICISS